MPKPDNEDTFALADNKEPKVLITTTRRANTATFLFAEELVDLFPNSEFRKRGSSHFVKDIVSAAIERDYTHLVIVNESRKAPDTLSIVKLPEGPTFLFQLSSIRLSTQIHNHGRSSSHVPELILNNFATQLGHTVGNMLISMFPRAPEFKGRQAVTFHNQRDFIFVRRHRYMFEGGKRARMQEIGPQFTLKLKAIYKAVCEFRHAQVEWEWKPHAVDSKAFSL